MWARALPTVWLLVAGVVISMEIAGRAVWNYSGDQNAEGGASALVESMHALQPALAEHTEQGPQPPGLQFTHVPTTPTLNDTADAVSSTIPRRPESCERSPAVYFPMATDCAGQSRDGSWSQQVTGHGGETAWDGSADTWTQCDRPAVQFVTTAKLVNGPHVLSKIRFEPRHFGPTCCGEDLVDGAFYGALDINTTNGSDTGIWWKIADIPPVMWEPGFHWKEVSVASGRAVRYVRFQSARLGTISEIEVYTGACPVDVALPLEAMARAREPSACVDTPQLLPQRDAASGCDELVRRGLCADGQTVGEGSGEAMRLRANSCCACGKRVLVDSILARSRTPAADLEWGAIRASQESWRPRNNSGSAASFPIGGGGGKPFCALRDYLQGRWERLDTVSEPLNYTCGFGEWDCTGRSAAEGERIAEALRWVWMPSECRLHTFSTERLQSILRGRTLLFVGDSLQTEMALSMQCLSRQSASLVFERLDLLGCDKGPDGAADCKDVNIMLHWGTIIRAHKLTDNDILVVNTGAHWHTSADAFKMNSEHLARVLAKLFNGTVIFRTTIAGHDHCAEYRNPAKASGSNFNWPTFDRVNSQFSGALRAAFDRALVLHVEMFETRPDGHMQVTKDGTEDCLHYCLPGPIHVWNLLLYHVLSVLHDADLI